MTNELWLLDIAFTVRCTRCQYTEEVYKDTAEGAIVALLSVGWQVNDVGPWCPECGPLLYARRAHTHGLSIGDVVCADNDRVPIGPVIRIGDGYAEVRTSNGYSAPYCLAELIQAK